MKKKLGFEDFIYEEDCLDTLMATFYFSSIQGDDLHATSFDDITGFITRYFQTKDYKIEPAKHFNGLICEKFSEFRFFFLKVNSPVKGADDAIAVQVGLSSPEKAPVGWNKMRTFINDLLVSFRKEIADDHELNTHVLGYALVYKTNIDENKLNFTELDGDIFYQALPLFTNMDPQDNFDLAVAKYPKGQIVLLNIPKATGWNAALIYLAACDSASASSLFGNEFFENNQRLMTVGAYVHKAFYQWQQLTGRLFTAFEKETGRMEEEIKGLLRDTALEADNNKLSQKISSLAGQLEIFMVPYIECKSLELSLRKQYKNLENNYFSYKLQTGNKNALFRFHLDILAQQTEAASLILERTEKILDNTTVAISLVESKLQKRSSDLTNRTQLYLAVLGCALAFIQIFDNEVAKGFLIQLRISTENQINWLGLLLTKLVVAFVFALICSGFYYIIKLVVRKSR